MPVNDRPTVAKAVRDCELSTSPSGVVTSPVRRPPPPTCSATRPLPQNISPAPPPSLVAVAASNVMFPVAPVTGLVGICSVITLTNPPIALAP